MPNATKENHKHLATWRSLGFASMAESMFLFHPQPQLVFHTCCINRLRFIVDSCFEFRSFSKLSHQEEEFICFELRTRRHSFGSLFAFNSER
ncbi:hypothetical protein CEXT_519011 [Caerostris extrusa]|uniref:Uncharacterized protein n=1 Tax=Caerostris extrusa TaxID=172846 RepID=A0AAV4WS16_CAEEX|nr:hypothetical protein CEXT_519011 [Caerostris extrusa]